MQSNTGDQDAAFAKSWFSWYYERLEQMPVPSIGSREFGFMFFDRSFMQRHTSFTGEGALMDFMRRRVPSHAYYSAAYYRVPGAPTMAEKGWKGTDLIFDLDADHVRGAEKLPYDQMLSSVKREVIRLYDDFVCGDLSFSEKETEIVFSGGRGYHIHVFAESVHALGSHERREIVDYITATDMDVRLLMDRTVVEKGSKPLERYRLPGSGQGGWKGKLDVVARNVVSELVSKSKEEAVIYLKSKGCSHLQAARMYEDLKRGGRRILADGNTDIFGRKEDFEAFLNVLKEELLQRMAAETDEPVTSDIHRLIRIPGTLHGKTAFRVVSMSREELECFNPLTDAIPPFPDMEVRVISDADFMSEAVGGKSVHMKEGENSIQLALALFLILRKKIHIHPEQE